MSVVDFDSLDDVLHNKLLLVPIYQRDYAWGNANIETLFEDLHELNTRRAQGQLNDKHFLGAIVLTNYETDGDQGSSDTFNDPKFGKWKKYYLIDGQQRLTTLSLLFLALHKYAVENNLTCAEIDACLHTPRQDSESKYVPILNFTNENTHKYYRGLINNDKSQGDERFRGARNMKSALALLSQKVEEEFRDAPDPDAALDSFTETILHYTQFVEIICADESDAYQIFESLNSTGLNLTPAEQVKNAMLMRSDKKDVTLQKWENLIGIVKEEKFVSFLANYLFYKNNKRVPRKEIYREIKGLLKLQGTTAVLEDLTACGNVYAELTMPTKACASSSILADLDALDQEQVFVPLLAAGRRFGTSSSEMKEIADAILVFITRHRVCGQSSNKLDTVFGSACELIKDESKSATDISNFFKEKQQTDSDFESYFARLRFDYSAKEQREARVYLKRIEQMERGIDQPLSLDDDGLTVEHIMPKQPDITELSGWIGEERATKMMKGSTVELDEFTNDCIKSIGNLALLYRPENASAGNGSYREKRAVYTSPLTDGDGKNRGIPKDVFKLIESLLENFPVEFDDKSISQRAQELAKLAKKHWA